MLAVMSLVVVLGSPAVITVRHPEQVEVVFCGDGQRSPCYTTTPHVVAPLQETQCGEHAGHMFWHDPPHVAHVHWVSREEFTCCDGLERSGTDIRPTVRRLKQVLHLRRALGWATIIDPT